VGEIEELCAAVGEEACAWEGGGNYEELRNVGALSWPLS